MNTKGSITISKANLVAIVIGIVVLVGLVILITTGNVKAPAVVNNGVANPTPVATSVPSQPTAPTQSATHAAVPADTTVPDKGAQNVPANVAVPQVQLPAAPGATSNLRSFDITETASAFTPSTIVVKAGDSVDIFITASGGAYDFTQPDYRLSLSIPNGATKQLGFGALSTGKFTFYCKSCGGPAKGPVGYIIVTNQ